MCKAGSVSDPSVAVIHGTFALSALHPSCVSLVVASTFTIHVRCDVHIHVHVVHRLATWVCMGLKAWMLAVISINLATFNFDIHPQLV